MKNYNRRKFIKTTTMSAAVLTAASTIASCTDNNIEPISKGLYMGGFSAPKLETVRVAFIGVGDRGSGHGGMDGIMRYRIIECLKNGLALDQNVYEGCFWSAVTPLSGKSILEGGMPQQFPDFTRGNWTKTKPLEIIT